MKTAVEHLAENVHELSDKTGLVHETVVSLRELTSAENLHRRRGRVLVALALAALLVLAGTCVVLLVQSRERGMAIRRVLSQVESCTTPGSACYDQNKRDQDAAIEKLLRSNIVIVECARQTTTDSQLESCVRQRLNRGDSNGE